MPTNNSAPGWFRDQSNSQQLRWWDGTTWTEHTSPLPVTETVPSPTLFPGAQAATVNSRNPAPKKPWYFRWWAITAAVLVALSIVGSLTPDENTPPADAAPSQTRDDSANEVEAVTTSPNPEEEAEPELLDTDGDGVVDDEDARPDDAKIQSEDDIDTDNDGVADFKDAFPKNPKFSEDTDGDGVADQLDAFPKDPEFSKDTDGDRVADSEDAFPSDPSRSKITLSMENALSSAQDYLDYSAFSRQGLIDQLSSQYGSGFNVADATWAVSQLRVDWKQQAVQAAKDYLDYSSFSRAGLIQQLSSPYGSQFTLEEATYAVNKIGL